MKEIEKILKLGSEYKVIKIDELKKNGKTINIIYIESKKTKFRCPECNKFTSSIHDKLKPIQLKGLKIYEMPTKIVPIKRRFICHSCKKKFTEQSQLSKKNSSISNGVKQKILKDLKDYNLSIKYIARENNVSEDTVSTHKRQKNLPRVISLDEFKADTNEGKYACILNDPIHKEVLDILPNRKKEYLIQYFTYCENRHQ